MIAQSKKNRRKCIRKIGPENGRGRFGQKAISNNPPGSGSQKEKKGGFSGKTTSSGPANNRFPLGNVLRSGRRKRGLVAIHLTKKEEGWKID